MKHILAGCCLFLLSLSSFSQNISVTAAQKKLEVLQSKGRGMFRMLDEKALKLNNGDVITTSVCFCDSVPGGTTPPFNYFSRRYGLITKAGKKLDPLFDNIVYWENDRYLVKYHEEVPAGSYDDMESWYALINRNLDVLNVYPGEGMNWDLFYRVKKSGKYGVINGSLNEVLPFVYDSLSRLSHTDEANIMYKERSFHTYAAKGENKWGLITTGSDTVMSFTHEYLDNSFGGYLLAKDKGKWGIINQSDSILVPFAYDSIFRVFYSFFVLKEKKWAFLEGTFDHKNAAYQYDEFAFNPARGYNMARIGNKWYFLRTSKIKETDPAYDGFYYDKDSGPFVCVKRADKYAIYNCPERKLVTEFVYSSISDVLYERGQDYDEQGNMTRDYPLYHFKVIRDSKEEDLTLKD